MIHPGPGGQIMNGNGRVVNRSEYHHSIPSGSTIGFGTVLDFECSQMPGISQQAQQTNEWTKQQVPGTSQQSQRTNKGTEIRAVTDTIQLQCPMRPNYGNEGREIILRVNHFRLTIPGGNIYYYNVDIHPDNCSRKFNRYI